MQLFKVLVSNNMGVSERYRRAPSFEVLEQMLSLNEQMFVLHGETIINEDDMKIAALHVKHELEGKIRYIEMDGPEEMRKRMGEEIRIMEGELEDEMEIVLEETLFNDEIEEDLLSLDREIESGEVEKKMKKKCLSCDKKCKYGEKNVVIRSQKGKKVLYTTFCENCSKKIKSKDTVCAWYEEGRGFLSMQDLLGGIF